MFCNQCHKDKSTADYAVNPKTNMYYKICSDCRVRYNPAKYTKQGRPNNNLNKAAKEANNGNLTIKGLEAAVLMNKGYYG